MTEFQAEKDEYYFGDTVNVRVIYDGSKCEKDATKISLSIHGICCGQAENETENNYFSIAN
jgi:hypothetical protein